MELNWYRSWPSLEDLSVLDNNHPRVIDRLPKLYISSYDYKNCEWPDDEPGFCLLEWDIALDRISRTIFASEALQEPREILVAPYRYWDTWCQWIGNDGSGPTEDGRPIKVGETRTDSIGLGCLYIPQVVLHEFLVQMDKFGFTDATFGKWYHSRYGQARVTWNVHPQHLHDYEFDKSEKNG